MSYRSYDAVPLIFSRYIAAKAFKNFLDKHIGTLYSEEGNLIKKSAKKGLDQKRR
jgi:hypothetical protein